MISYYLFEMSFNWLDLVLLIVIIGILILIHEIGHYLACRYFKIRVKQFAVGFGPALYKKKVGDTIYRINAFPLGGYNDILGEGEDVKSKDSFSERSIRQRAAVILAGPLLNIVLAIFLFYPVMTLNNFTFELPLDIGVQPVFGQTEQTESQGIYVTGTIEGQSAHEENLPTPIVLKEVDGQIIKSHRDLSQLLGDRKGEEVSVSYYLLDEKTGLKLDRVESKDLHVNDEGMIGIILYEEIGLKIVYNRPIDKILVGFEHSVNILQIGVYVAKLLIGTAVVEKTAAPLQDLSYSPIGIYQAVQTTRISSGVVGILSLVALISLNLGIVNLFPIPALDGGHLLFLFVEKLRGKRFSQENLALVSFIGFALMMILSVVVIFKDIWQFGLWDQIRSIF